MILIKVRLKNFLNKRNIFYSKVPFLEPADVQKTVVERILEHGKSVLHIGAHLGQEAENYANHRLDVIWIEAIPEVANKLREFLVKFPSQKVYCLLLGSRNDPGVKFNLSSNNFESSSIYEFGNEIGFANLEMTHAITLPMVRLDSAFTHDDLKGFKLWVIDVQGAELDVLLGAGDLLNICNLLLVEVSTREVYSNGTKWLDLKRYLNDAGFIEMITPGPNHHSDVLFIRG